MFDSQLFIGVSLVSIGLLGLVFVGFYFWDKWFKLFQPDPYSNEVRHCKLCGQVQVLKDLEVYGQFEYEWQVKGVIINPQCECHRYAA